MASGIGEIRINKPEARMTAVESPLPVTLLIFLFTFVTVFECPTCFAYLPLHCHHSTEKSTGAGLWTFARHIHNTETEVPKDGASQAPARERQE